MTTFHYHNGVFYADTRAFVNAQPFSISGKIVPVGEPFEAKAVVFQKDKLAVTIDDTIIGYFIGHAVQPARALFECIESAARANPEDVQAVLMNYTRFIEHFKLAATESHFSLHLIGVKGIYTITTPWNIEQGVSYDYTPYVSEEFPQGGRYSMGANHEILSAYTSAGMPTVIAYYLLFMTQPESGGNIESWKIRHRNGQYRLMRHDVFLEATKKEMTQAIDDWHAMGDKASQPTPDMSGIFKYGPDIMTGWRLESYLSAKGFSMMRDENEIVTHLVPKRGKPIDLRRSLDTPKDKANKT